MNALIIDVETTDVDPNSGELIEIGAVVYDFEHYSPSESWSFLIRPENATLDSLNTEALKVHGIAPEMVLKHGITRDTAIARLLDLSKGVDAAVAHNAEFEKVWLPEIETPWVCTMTDIEWPGSHGRKLSDIALCLGVGVVRAHRAIEDVLTVADMFTRCQRYGHDLLPQVKAAMAPSLRYRAHVSFETKDLAKEQGFNWDRDRKTWWKNLRASDAEKAEEWGFKISVDFDALSEADQERVRAAYSNKIPALGILTQV